MKYKNWQTNVMFFGLLILPWGLILCENLLLLFFFPIISSGSLVTMVLVKVRNVVMD